MTTAKQLAANQSNSRLSTGPKSAVGKRRSAANSLKHGLFAVNAVVPELGESADGWGAFREGVLADLAPEGAMERELACRAALLIWRLARAARVDTAAAIPDTTGLPPDPAQVRAASDDVVFAHPLKPDAPIVVQLAYVRQWVKNKRRFLEGIRGTAGLLAGRAGDPVDCLIALELALARAAGWSFDEALIRIGSIRAVLGLPIS